MDPESLARARADVDLLSAEEVRQLLRGAQVPDERTFIEATSIDDKERGGLVGFRLWESQATLLPLLSSPRLYVLKARQLGLTWLSLVHWLYMTTFWSNRLILVARQSREDALDALRRIKLLRASLGGAHPDWQQRIAVQRRRPLCQQVSASAAERHDEREESGRSATECHQEVRGGTAFVCQMFAAARGVVDAPR